MNRALTFLLAAAVSATFLFAASPAHAADKFGVVDFDEVFKKTTAGRKAVETWKKYEKKLEKEAETTLKPMKDQLETKLAEFQKQMETMKPAAREKKQEVLQKKYKEYMEKAKEFEGKAQKKYEEIVGPIHKKLQEVIYDMGIEKGYTLIFRKNEAIIPFATSKVDITEDVIREFNKRK